MNAANERQQSAKITARELVARHFRGDTVLDPVAFAAELHELRTSTVHRLLAFLETGDGAETYRNFLTLRIALTDELDSREPWPPTH